MKKGQILVIGILVLGVVLIISASLFERTAIFLRSNSNSLLREQATSLAEAGIDYAVQRLNDTAGAYPNISGEGTDTQTLTVGEVGITVANKSQNVKTITATGYIPNSTSPRAKRTVKADVGVNSTQIAFRYAVQVGTGGVVMANSARIIGTVYSNKPGINSIDGSGSSRIEGDAWAVGTISSPDPTVTGTKHPNENPSVMPTVNYQQWEDEATTLGTTNCAGGTCTYDTGTPELQGKYIGNLTLQNTAAARMDGVIWVTGNLTVQNSASIKLNDSFGSSGSVLLVGNRQSGTGGKITTDNSGSFIPTNASLKGYILVTSVSSLNDAILIQNSGVNAVFYALEGGAELQNTANVTALVANKITIKNNAILSYDSGLAGANFSSGPTGGWSLIKGTYRQTSPP